MILKHSNGDFDFEPLMAATEDLLFKNEDLIDWISQQMVQSFDEIHATLAALFYVCHQKNFKEFANNLNLFLTLQGIDLNPARLQFYMSGIESILEAKKRRRARMYLSQLDFSNRQTKSKMYKTPAKLRRISDLESVSAKSKSIQKNSGQISTKNLDSGRHKKAFQGRKTQE